MTTVATILSDVRTLSNDEKKELLTAIGEIIMFSSYAKNITQE